jgi:hypothetical protein
MVDRCPLVRSKAFRDFETLTVVPVQPGLIHKNAGVFHRNIVVSKLSNGGCAHSAGRFTLQRRDISRAAAQGASHMKTRASSISTPATELKYGPTGISDGKHGELLAAPAISHAGRVALWQLVVGRHERSCGGGATNE